MCRTEEISWNKPERGKEVTGEMKDEPLRQSNCAVESISNLINTVLYPLLHADPALIYFLMRSDTVVRGIIS